MRVVKTKNSNHNFGPPPGQEDSIGDLPCEIDDIIGWGNGQRVIWSVWKPSNAERELIAQGANVKLGVGWIGGFPPVSVGVTEEELDHE